MAILWYVSHPEVRIDADVPVPRWGLTDHGRARAVAMCTQPWIADVDRLISSDETKALELAAIVATHRALPIEVRPSQAETDRSSTGFVPPARHDELATAWFTTPDHHEHGWEPARRVQDRVVMGLDDVLRGHENVLVAGHGGAGTLLLCHLAGQPIEASRDQPGAGHYFTVDLTTRRPLHAWRPIDTIEP